MELQEYLLLNYKPRRRKESSFKCYSISVEPCSLETGRIPSKSPSKPKQPKKLPFKLEKPFMEQVFEIIDSKGLDEVETYKKADIDRRLFSKMRSDYEYRPSKDTAIKICLALSLTLDETKNLLSIAGYTLSKASLKDQIIAWCISEGNFDLQFVNDALYDYGLHIVL